MPATTFRNRKTPGVYVTELNAFPPSVVGVQTAIPGFIGYTEKAEISGKPVFFQPIAINSLAEYEAIFGAGFKKIYDIAAVDEDDVATDPDAYDFMVTGGSPPANSYYALEGTSDSEFNLYDSLRLFYDNGGGSCYVVSVGTYKSNSSPPGDERVSEPELANGLDAMGEQIGPTMLVVPDAVLLPADLEPIDNTDIPKSAAFAAFVKKMLAQCGDLQDRVAILDVYGADALKQTQEVSSPDRPAAATFNIDLTELIQNFQDDVGSDYLNYGMAYFPPLNSSIIDGSEIDYTNFNIEDPDQLDMLQGILETVADELYGSTPVQRGEVQKYIDDMDPERTDPSDTAAVETLDNNLVNALPILAQIEVVIAAKVNVLPASGAMAGVYTKIDQTRGVWNAPANTSLVSVVSPTVLLNDTQQGNLNVPLNGKAVDVIRQFTGRGTVVWGARTLDGNSQDWRYIQVRRTLIYVEQSIKAALDPFVFDPNNGRTWATVTSMVSNFLQGLWSQGGLMGATADEAFTVECGLGSTMTAQDILDGYMIVQVTLQMIRPAEFIELTFKQQMEGA